MEYLNGSLRDYLKKKQNENNTTQERIIRLIFVDVMRKMSTLIQYKIIYTDLKTDNILYYQDENDTYLKLGDFGSFYFYNINGSTLGTPTFSKPSSEYFSTVPEIFEQCIFQCITFWWELAYPFNPMCKILRENYNKSNEHTLVFRTQFDKLYKIFNVTNEYSSFNILEDIFDNFANIADKCESFFNYNWNDEKVWSNSWNNLRSLIYEGGKNKTRTKLLSRKKTKKKKTKRRKKIRKIHPRKKSNKRKIKTKKTPTKIF